MRNIFTYADRWEELLMSASHHPSPRSSLFPYKFYRDDVELYYNDGGAVGFLLECMPIVGCDAKVLKQISLLFDDILPLRSILEVLLVASDNLDPIIETWTKNRTQSDKIYREVEGQRKSRLNESNPTTNFRNRNYRLYLAFSTKTKGAEEICVEFRKKLRQVLDAIGMSMRAVGPRDFLSLVREIVHYPDYRDVFYRENEILAEQLEDVSNALLVADGSIFSADGDFVTRCYGVESYPSEFSISHIPLLLGDAYADNMQIPGRFAISYIISNALKDLKQEEMRAKGETVLSQVKSFLGRYSRELTDEGEEWRRVMKHLKGNEKFISTSLAVLLTAPTEQIAKAEQSLVSLWKKNDFFIKCAKYFQLPMLLRFCPFVVTSGLWKVLRKFGAVRTVLSSEPKALMPIHGEWKGHSTGGMIFTGRRGQVFTWDSFEQTGNYNVCLIGMSGSGKSVFLQEFVINQLAKGTRVFVVDIGRSFEKTCKLFCGDFLSFGPKSNVSLNPFSSISGESSEVVEDSLSLLRFIIAKMVAPKAGTVDIQDAIIASSVGEVWRRYGNKGTIDHLVQILGNKGQGGSDMSTMLFEYTSNGHYGRFFNRESNVSFEKQLTVLEFEELRNRPDLGAVVMQMLSVQILQQVYLGDRQQRFVIVFDEAWYALQHFPELLCEMARTVRKYNGGLILGTQSLGDFSDSGPGEFARLSVMENCAWRVLLKQKSGSLDRALSVGFSEMQIEIAKTLEIVENCYSESLICQSDQDFFVARLMLDDFSRTLYSSSPEIFARVQRYMDSGYDVTTAIKKLLCEDSNLNR